LTAWARIGAVVLVFHQTFIVLPLSRHLPDARIQENNFEAV
jgi:hypothetical protein